MKKKIIEYNKRGEDMKSFTKIMSVFLVTVILFLIPISAYAIEKYEAPVKGIDVSYWQGEVDFKAVKESGVSFVIMRIGTSYSKDSTFERNYQNARENGLDIGCYFYTYSKDVESARKDAEDVISWIGDKQLEYPVYFDIEDPSLEGLPKTEKMAICEEFRQRVGDAGFLVGLYTNSYWLDYLLDKELCYNNYEIWLANWTSTGLPDKDMSGICNVWQYTDKGVVVGVKGGVDLDLSYYDYPTYVKENGLNNYEKVEEPEDIFNILRRYFKSFFSIVKLLISLLK